MDEVHSIAKEPTEFPSEILEKYENIQLLGKGAFATVLSLEEKATRKRVACKAIEVQVYTERNMGAQLELEVETADWASQQHSNIVTVFLVVRASTYIFLLMEMMRTNLNIFMQSVQRQRVHESISGRWMYQVASALNFLHENRIIHRDVKLENILYDPSPEDSLQGSIRLTDFGWCARMDDNGKCGTSMCGTPSYNAPEIAAGVSQTKKVDAWSLGVCAFITITGAQYQLPSGEIPRRLHHFSSVFTATSVDVLTHLLEDLPSCRLSLSEAIHRPFFNPAPEAPMSARSARCSAMPSFNRTRHTSPLTSLYMYPRARCTNVDAHFRFSSPERSMMQSCTQLRAVSPPHLRSSLLHVPSEGSLSRYARPSGFRMRERNMAPVEEFLPGKSAQRDGAPATWQIETMLERGASEASDPEPKPQMPAWHAVPDRTVADSDNPIPQMPVWRTVPDSDNRTVERSDAECSDAERLDAQCVPVLNSEATFSESKLKADQSLSCGSDQSCSPCSNKSASTIRVTHWINDDLGSQELPTLMSLTTQPLESSQSSRPFVSDTKIAPDFASGGSCGFTSPLRNAQSPVSCTKNEDIPVTCVPYAVPVRRAVEANMSVGLRSPPLGSMRTLMSPPVDIRTTRPPVGLCSPSLEVRPRFCPSGFDAEGARLHMRGSVKKVPQMLSRSNSQIDPPMRSPQLSPKPPGQYIGPGLTFMPKQSPRFMAHSSENQEIFRKIPSIYPPDRLVATPANCSVARPQVSIRRLTLSSASLAWDASASIHKSASQCHVSRSSKRFVALSPHATPDNMYRSFSTKNLHPEHRASQVRTTSEQINLADQVIFCAPMSSPPIPYFNPSGQDTLSSPPIPFNPSNQEPVTAGSSPMTPDGTPQPGSPLTPELKCSSQVHASRKRLSLGTGGIRCDLSSRLVEMAERSRLDAIDQVPKVMNDDGGLGLTVEQR